jgi:uncharacterized protein (TIGR02145 family)
MEGSTITYNWEIVRNNADNHASLGKADSSTVELIFDKDILNKGALVGNPGVADTIVLQCTVNDGLENYVLQRTITVGDRDECSPAAGLLDAEGNSYTVSRFGGVCWMTQNLRSKWTKQGSQVQRILEGTNEFNDPNAVVYYYPNGNTNSPPEYGFLYTWGAANIGTATTEATDAFLGKTSDRQGICPEGWTLPSDYDWNQLEKEIATNPGKYTDDAVAPYLWDSSYETNSGWRPLENFGWGRTMKSNTKVTTTTTNGVSTNDGTGFNALLVGYLESVKGLGFGWYTAFLSSSAGDSTTAWFRRLENTYSSVNRTIINKYYLFSVRCKK